MKLQENIIKLRKKRGLTQEQLAALLHVSEGAVSKWENGNNRPDLELLPDLAEIFQVSIDALFGYEKSYKNLEQIREKVKEYLEKEQYETAIEQLEELLKRYPNDFQTNKLLADAYYSQCFSAESGRIENIKRAVCFYERSMELYEERYCEISNIESLELQIATLYQLEECPKYEESNAILRKYNAGGKYDNLIAANLFALGKGEEAKKVMLHHCVGNQIFSFHDFSMLAFMYEQEGDYETAIRFLEAEIASFEVFLKEEGNYANRAYAGQAEIISRLYEKTGNLQKAEEWKKRAVFHAKKYCKNPSMQISSLKYCDGIDGRMIDSFGEIVKKLAEE
ncbi:MAG: helix-turn-helix domain-containing protein [Roseburia sp.]